MENGVIGRVIGGSVADLRLVDYEILVKKYPDFLHRRVMVGDLNPLQKNILPLMHAVLNAKRNPEAGMRRLHVGH